MTSLRLTALALILISIAGCKMTEPDTSKKVEAGNVKITCENELITEYQITCGPKNHFLSAFDPFSPDDEWLLYDTRTDETAMGSNSGIEKVNVHSGQIVVIYTTGNQTRYGPGCGTASYHPFENKIVFIHGLLNCTAEKPYGFSRRTAVMVDESNPGKPIFIDARDVTPPFTPGALRGGTHAHQFSGDGRWLGFTYNDAVMANLEKKTGKTLDLRTVGVATGPHPVKVDKDALGENNDGIWFSVLVGKVTPDPRPGSDEISRAFSDAWVGKKGYRKPDGSVQRARAFFGKLRTNKNTDLTELFIVDIPERIDIPGPDGPLEGTPETFPMPPAGARQRRLTHTENRKFPGVCTETRHWPVSSADGSYIALLAKDDNGIVQIYLASALDGELLQSTDLKADVESTLTWHPDGRKIAFVSDNSIFVCDVENQLPGKSTRLTKPTPDRPIHPGWSHDGTMIAYDRLLVSRRKTFRQIFVLKLK